MAKQSLKSWEGRLKSPAYWWATFFGIGMIPTAPGTWGSLAAAIAGYGMIFIGFDTVMLCLCSLGVTLISVKAINHIEQKTAIHDSGEIVIDEVAGQWLAMLPLVFVPNAFTIENLGYSFALFRAFDILKPWPISYLDRHISGGFGVMIDDLLAGLMAALTLWMFL